LVSFATYNLYDYGRGVPSRDPPLRQRYDTLTRVITGLDVDVLAVQEVIAETGDLAGQRLRELADAVGMTCVADRPVLDGPARIAVGPAASGFHVGLMWRSGIQPVPGSLRRIGGPGDLWHAMATILLDVGGPTPVRFGSYHADPFRPDRRFTDAFRVAAAFHDGRPAALGADFNSLSADRRTGDDAYYDPDPFPGQSPYPRMIHQVRWSDDPHATPRADRRSTDVLRRAGLHDVAVVIDAPWQPTTGYWSAMDYGPRRIDAIRVTAHVVPALAGYRVVATPAAKAASDHLPAVMEFQPEAITTPDGAEGAPDQITPW
jgi:endonuclease/exonuclease/phosphatase family metal-dependent hydrolase